MNNQYSNLLNYSLFIHNLRDSSLKKKTPIHTFISSPYCTWLNIFLALDQSCLGKRLLIIAI